MWHSPTSSGRCWALAGAELKKLSRAGDTVQRVCALPAVGFLGGAWNAEGTIIFASGGTSASLFSVPAAGGEAKPLTTHDASREETGHFWPWFLPDGRRFLFDVTSSREESAGLHVASLNAPEQRTRLLPANARVLYASGHLLFVRDGILLAQPFDARSLTVSGEHSRGRERGSLHEARLGVVLDLARSGSCLPRRGRSQPNPVGVARP